MKCFSVPRHLYTMLTSCSLLLLSACATTARTENVIEERAMARWETLLSGDLAAAWEYLSPGYRSSVSSERYQQSVVIKRVKWTGARYIESDCIETTCKVKISIDYTLHGAIPGVQSFTGTQAIEESWLLVDGKWYLVPKQ